MTRLVAILLFIAAVSFCLAYVAGTPYLATGVGVLLAATIASIYEENRAADENE